MVQEFQGLLVPEGLLVQLGLLEKKAILGSLDPLDHLDYVGLLEKLALRVLGVKKGPRAPLALLVLQLLPTKIC